MSRLKQVLTYFDDPTQSISINSIAQEMGITRGQVEGMIDFWVRKGYLRLGSISESTCGSCGVNGECPFAQNQVECYELVR